MLTRTGPQSGFQTLMLHWLEPFLLGNILVALQDVGDGKTSPVPSNVND